MQVCFDRISSQTCIPLIEYTINPLVGLTWFLADVRDEEGHRAGTSSALFYSTSFKIPQKSKVAK